MQKLWWRLLGVVVIVAGAVAPLAADERPKFLLLATNRTGTMEDELNEAGGRGYRFAGADGEAGGELVTVMRLDPAGRRFRYLLLATRRTGTMQQELNEAPPEFDLAGVTASDDEVLVILEAVVDE